MILVIGGGIAGISAAVDLAEKGLAVTLIEARHELGGRARSFRDASGEEADIGQHIVMRATTQILSLYERLGVSDRISWHTEIPLWIDGRMHVLATGPSALFTFTGLTLLERAHLARILLSARSPRAARLDGGRFLDEIGARGRVRELLDLLLVSALNALPAECSSDAVRFFLTEALGKPGASGIGVAKIPLSRLLDPVREVLSKAGGEVRTGLHARQILIENGRAAGVHLAPPPERGGRETGVIRGERVILAVAPREVRSLLSPTLAGRAPFDGLDRISSAPICGVHFYFDTPVPGPPLAGLLGRPTHWFFAVGNRISATYSAAHRWIGATREDLIRTARRDLALTHPEAARRKPRTTVVAKDAHATFVPSPGMVRPRSETPVQGLFLAGDYCDTGWPSTMESAARSGREAVRALLRT